MDYERKDCQFRSIHRKFTSKFSGYYIEVTAHKEQRALTNVFITVTDPRRRQDWKTVFRTQGVGLYDYQAQIDTLAKKVARAILTVAQAPVEEDPEPKKPTVEGRRIPRGEAVEAATHALRRKR